jgi:hypothetical protein
MVPCCTFSFGVYYNRLFLSVTTRHVPNPKLLGFGYSFGYWVGLVFGFCFVPRIMMIIFTKKVALFASQAPQNTSSEEEITL